MENSKTLSLFILRRMFMRSAYDNVRDFSAWILAKIKTIVYLIHNQLVANEVYEQIRGAFRDKRVKTAIKVFLAYVAFCLLFEFGKQFMISKHQNYLIKKHKANRKYMYNKRMELREQLELAVVKGNEADI